jgi:predicted nucleic acid-binding protein
LTVVIDTSAILAVLMGEPERAKLIKITNGVTLLTPQSLHWEIGNALSAMLKKIE